MKRLDRFALGKVLAWLMLPTFGFGLYLAYRWAEPSPEMLQPVHAPVGTSVTVRLENAPLEGSVDGQKIWSLFAKDIDLTKPGDGGLGSVQSAMLTGIRNGALFQGDLNSSLSKGLRPAALTTHRADEPTATFRADHGQYLLGTQDLIPPDLRVIYTARWQFRLSGKVDLRTRDGDRLQSEALTILDLKDQKTSRPERRILCEQGADVTVGGARIHSNNVRYNPEDRTVECLGGVHGQFKSNILQTERVYWTLKDQVLRCPQTAFGTFPGGTVQADQLTWSLKDQFLRCPGLATGTMQGVPFSAQDLTIDARLQRLHAVRLHAQLAVDQASLQNLGAIGR